MPAPGAPAKPAPRILSMDQYRGYAIFGMLLVDYFGNFEASLLDPETTTGITWVFAHLWHQLHHPHGAGFTFADLIAPVFMFVVGMGMRLSMTRRMAKGDVHAARMGLVKRYGMIIMLGFTIYTGYLWDALLNIGLAGMLVLWVVDKKPWQRFAFGVGMVSLYQLVCLYTSYGEIVHRTMKYTGETMPLIWKLIPIGPTLLDVPINGGPLGHWSWAFMMIGGTLAYDILATRDRRKITFRLLAWGFGLALAGLVLQSEWVGIKESWPIAKNWASGSYSVWSTGLCFLNLLLFYYICDVWSWEIPNLTVLGINPLAIYVLQWCICESGSRFINSSAPWWYIFLGWAIFYGVIYGTARYFYDRNIFIKI